VLAASIIRAIASEASTVETSVKFYQTARRSNPEDRHLRTRRRENLKSHLYKVISTAFIRLTFHYYELRVS
jgi:hypothetical protein